MSGGTLLAYRGNTPFPSTSSLFSSKVTLFFYVSNVCSVSKTLFLCIYYVSKCLKSDAVYRIEMNLFSILTSCFVQFTLVFFSSVDIWCCNVGKKENVKSCIIYEICIKEICNSIINKILIQFLEPVVQWRFVFVVPCERWLMDVLQKFTRSSLSRSWPSPPALLGLQLFLCRTS